MKQMSTFMSTFVTTLASALLAAAPLMAAQAQPSADRLLTQMKTDAQAIQSHASKLASLTRDTNTRWGQFDEQWNEIKPAEEALQMKFERLEGMRATLTDQQRKDLDQAKPAVENIATRTHRLYQAIDKPGMDLTSRRVRSDAQALGQDAATVVRNS